MYENKKESAGDFKRGLYDSFKANGILDSMKANMRSKIFENLKKRNASTGGGERGISIKDKLDGKENNLVFKLCISLINDFLKKSELAYTMSVLIPESGLGAQTLTKSELEEVLKLKADPYKDDDDEPLKKPNSSLLQDIVEAMRRGQSIRPNLVTCSVQTDEGEEGLTLDDKLKKLDLKYMQEVTAERVMPYKILEERMIKYKRECDERARKDIESEIARVRDIEISHVRLEEAASYRSKLAEFRNELDSMHKEKIKELRLREAEVLERWKIKEREIEAVAFEHRQKVIKDLEMLRFKELESKKTVEMELIVIKNEREKLFQKEKESDLKLKDLSLLKAALEKKSQSEIDEYRRRWDAQHEDERREVQVRRMQLEEDEHRFELNKQKFLNSEKDKTQLEKDNLIYKDKLDKLVSEHEKMTKEYYEIKDQLKVLSNNGLRDHEIINSRTMQAETLENESKTLRELLQAQKDQMRSEKDTNKEIIENLNHQIQNYKEENKGLRQRYSEEVERVVQEGEREKDGFKNVYKMEESRLKHEINHLNRKVEWEQHLTKELTIVNDKLMNDHSNIRSKYQIDEIGREAYIRGDAASIGVRQTDFLTANGIPIVGNMFDPELGEEYLARQKAWNDLDIASRDVKRNITKIGLIPISEHNYAQHYDLEDENQFDDDSPHDVKNANVKLDHFEVLQHVTPSQVRNTPEKKKPGVTKEDLDKLEKDRKQKDDFSRQQLENKAKREKDDRERKERQDREEREREREQIRKQQEKDKRDRDAKKVEEVKVPTLVSDSVKNPFAKKMGGGKKPDPILAKDIPKIDSRPASTYGISGTRQDKLKPSKSSSGEIEDIQDNYDFNIEGGKEKQPSDDIKEDISEAYSGFEDNDPLEDFIF